MKELNEFILNQTDISAWNLAEFYFAKKDYVGAVSFYIRTTELTKNTELLYKAHLKLALCLWKQGNRTSYVKSMLLHAITINPKRPEAYFLLSKSYEESKDWQESYTMCEIALNNCDFSLPIIEEVDYVGKWGFDFEKSVVSWYMGRDKESIELSLKLYEGQEMPEEYLNAVKGNIKHIWGTLDYTKATYYKKGDNIRFTFPGLDELERNYSQAFQDLFILNVLNGKKDGKYLEIGAFHPTENSNTKLLETNYNWKGISLDIQSTSVISFNAKRFNECILSDATKTDYKKLMDEKNWGNVWDYLQVDCEPAETSMLALLQIPLHEYKFRVITFEHDYYADETKSIREKSRRYLKSMGYELVIENISVDEKSPFEDWWVHPELVDREIIDKIRMNGEIIHAKKWIFNDM